MYLLIFSVVTSAEIRPGSPPTKGISSGSVFPTLGTDTLEAEVGVPGVVSNGGGGGVGPLHPAGGRDLRMIDAGDGSK